MSDPRRISEVMDADPDWRKLLKHRKPQRLTVPWPDAVMDHLPNGDDVEVVKVRGPARESQCWQALGLYQSGESIEGIAAKLSEKPETVRAWVRQTMGAR